MGRLYEPHVIKSTTAFSVFKIFNAGAIPSFGPQYLEPLHKIVLKIMEMCPIILMAQPTIKHPVLDVCPFFIIRTRFQPLTRLYLVFASLNETAKTEETSSAPSPSISIIVKDSADEPFTADEIIFLVFIFGIVPIAVSITICWAYGKFRRRRRRKAREKKQEMLNDRLGLTFKDAQYTTSTTIVAPYTLSRKDEYDSSESEDEEDRAPLIAPSQTLRIDTQSQPTNSDNALLPTPYTLYSVSSTVVGRPSITLAPTPVRPALQLETDNDTRFQSVTPGVELNPHTPIAQFLEPRDVVLSPYVQPSPDPNSTQVSEKVKERRSYLLRQLEAARTQFDQLSRRASTLPSGTINIEAIAPSSESNLESWQPTSNAPFVTLSSPIDINFLAATVALPGTEDASNLNDQQQHRLQQQYAQGGQPLNQDDTYLLPQAPPGQASGGVDPQIQAYLDQLSNTISRLNELVQSSYALGQSDDPPPGYFD